MAPMSASKSSSKILGLLFHPFLMPFSSMMTSCSRPNFNAILANVSPRTSFVRAFVRKPSCLLSCLSNRNLVMTNPRTESSINSRVSKDSVNCSYSLRADLCVKDFWYKSRFLIFVPTSCSALSLVRKVTIVVLLCYVCVIFLSLLLLLLNVVRAQVLLEVKVSDLDVRRRREEVAKLVVEDNLTAVVGVLETLIGDVLVNELGHLGTGDEFTSGKSEKLSQLRRHILLAVEAVVGGTSLSLLTIGILLSVLHFADELGEVLDVVAERGEFGLNGFEGHYIFLTCLTFKFLKKYIVATVTNSHTIKTNLLLAKLINSGLSMKRNGCLDPSSGQPPAQQSDGHGTTCCPFLTPHHCSFSPVYA